jgi:hypothetical protein
MASSQCKAGEWCVGHVVVLADNWLRSTCSTHILLNFRGLNFRGLNFRGLVCWRLSSVRLRRTVKFWFR